MSRHAMLFCFLLLACAPLHAGQWFVATTGNDTTGTGAPDQPFRSIARAASAVAAGDSITVRGGTYKVTTTITISKSGTAAAPCLLAAAPGERAVLDCSSMSFGLRGIRLSGSYWRIRGLDVRGAGDNGMYITGSNNVVDFCSFYENQDTGLQLGGGASRNRIINCDSYYNRDPGQGNADGFSPKLDVGDSNSFAGCRSWQNSDDGYDGYLRPSLQYKSDDSTTIYTDCWAFMNGYLKDGTKGTGNGNGFKTGGSDTPRVLMHNAVLIRCVAFDNKAKGFDQNHNRGSITLYNCSAYRNGASNYAFSESLAYSKGKVLTVINSLALGPYGSLSANSVQKTNSWMGWTVTASDFVSIDTAGARGPRKPDGSLPDVPFLHLAQGSALIDAGTDIGIPFLGSAPDLGAFESSPSLAVTPPADVPSSGDGFRVIGTYPNPFNPSTTIACVLPERGEVAVSIFDARGQLVREFPRRLEQAGRLSVAWDGRSGEGAPVASGVYFVRISFRNRMRTARLVFLR